MSFVSTMIKLCTVVIWSRLQERVITFTPKSFMILTLKAATIHSIVTSYVTEKTETDKQSLD